jgi:hypothetical protein
MGGGNMSENIGYMMSPLGLTERQILIYQKLYEKCNFADMTVKYTIDQLACDIKIVDIPIKTIYKNIQSMIKSGYLEVIQKASKGNAPVYRIIPINEIIEKMGEPKVSQERTKGEPKPSNNEGLNSKQENQRRTKREPKFHPIKEKEKENIYSDSIKKIISLYPGKKTKAIRDKKLPGIIEQYGEEQIIRCVERYSKDVANQRKTFPALSYMNESTFWNGRYLDYLDQEQNEELTPKEPFKPKIKDMGYI